MHRSSTPDRGSVLPLVLVLTVVFGALVAAIATYTATALRSTSVTSGRVDRLADAEGGLRRALATLAATGACAPGSTPGPNGSTVQTATCESQVLATVGEGQRFGLVLTGLGLSGEAAFRRFTPDSETVGIGGEVFLSAGVTGSASNVEAHDGARVQRTSCVLYQPEPLPWLIVGEPVTCTEERWEDVSPAPTGISVPNSPGVITTEGACRVYWPGTYPSIDVSGNSSKNYFRSGVYLVEGGMFDMRGDISAGHPPGTTSITPTSPNSACRDAQIADLEDGGGPGGAVFILAGNAAITFANQLSSFEVYGYAVGDRIYSVIAAPPGTPDLPANTRTPRFNQQSQIRPIINNPPTPNFKFLGEVWVPGSFIDLSNLSSWQAGRGFLGGVTASRFEFKQTGGAVGGLQIISLEHVHQTIRHRITVTATDPRGTTTVSAVARRNQLDFTLESWRVH